MQTIAPNCYKCEHRNPVMVVKGKPRCKKFPQGIDKKVFFEGKNCPQFSKKKGAV